MSREFNRKFFVLWIEFVTKVYFRLNRKRSGEWHIIYEGWYDSKPDKKQKAFAIIYGLVSLILLGFLVNIFMFLIPNFLFLGFVDTVHWLLNLTIFILSAGVGYIRYYYTPGAM